jgi:hypothetical protein
MSTRTSNTRSPNRFTRIGRLAVTALAATALTLGVTTLIAPSAKAAPNTKAGILQLTPSIPIPPPHPTRSR